MGAAALIVSIKLFNLQIDKAGTLGIEIKNFTTGALVLILFVAMVYHGIAFAIRAFEEYRLWELNLTKRETTTWGGGLNVIDLSSNLASASETLQKITANSGAIIAAGQTIFTQTDAANLKEVSDAAQLYAKRLKNFPTITRVRFWGWDIGLAMATMIIAALFAWSLLPSTHQLFCAP